MLALNRLDRHDRTALVEQIAGGRALPDEVVDQIVDRTDGVPLFVEELTKSVLESGLLREEGDRYVLDGALPPFAIPTTLHASLLARLDRLASVRLVAQTGAAIGREFAYALLRAVSRLPEDELQAALARLVASEGTLQLGSLPAPINIGGRRKIRRLSRPVNSPPSIEPKRAPHTPDFAAGTRTAKSRRGRARFHLPAPCGSPIPFGTGGTTFADLENLARRSSTGGQRLLRQGHSEPGKYQTLGREQADARRRSLPVSRPLPLQRE